MLLMSQRYHNPSLAGEVLGRSFFEKWSTKAAVSVPDRVKNPIPVLILHAKKSPKSPIRFYPPKTLLLGSG